MKIKISDLIGPALDWAVAFAINEQSPETVAQDDAGRFYDWNPSTVWSQGGPIIEREWIQVTPWPNERDEDERWRATQFDTREVTGQNGSTPLIAAMRCYVASRLGNEVDIPNELA